MDSYYRDSARSPGDRAWESRGKIERTDDSFYRGRSPGRSPGSFVYGLAQLAASLYICDMSKNVGFQPFLSHRPFHRNTRLLLVSQVMTDVGPTALDLPCLSTGMSLGEEEKITLLATEMTGAALRLRPRTSIDMSLGRRLLRLNLWRPTPSKIH